MSENFVKLSCRGYFELYFPRGNRKFSIVPHKLKLQIGMLCLGTLNVRIFKYSADVGVEENKSVVGNGDLALLVKAIFHEINAKSTQALVKGLKFAFISY